MAVSLPEQASRTCAQCGHRWEELIWLVIDLEERPDLHSVLTTPVTYTVECPECRAEAERPEPLIVLELSPVAPLLFACSLALLEEKDPLALFPELTERTGAEVDRRGRVVSGPVLPLPYGLLYIAAHRDLKRDLDDPAAAAHEVGGDDTGAIEMWEYFLGEVAGSHAARRREQARRALFDLRAAEHLRQAFVDYPELNTPEVVEEMRVQCARATSDEQRMVGEIYIELLTDAQRGDLEQAWARHRQRMSEVDLVGPQVDPLLARSNPETGDWPVVLQAAMELRELAEAIGEEELKAEASARAATALYEQTGPERPANLERAIPLLEEATEFYATSDEDPEHLGRLLTNLGAAVAARFSGDRLASLERSAGHLREAIQLLRIDGDGRAWAMAHANLGLTLTEIARLRPLESERREQELREAIRHLETSFEWRSFEREPLDWAYTQLNLGLAKRHLPRTDRPACLEEALVHYGDAVSGYEAAGRGDLATQARMNRADVLAELGGREKTGPERKLVAEGVDLVRRALADLQPNSIEAGYAWRQLGNFLAGKGYSPELVDAYRNSLAILTPEVAPQVCRETAARLSDMAAGAGDWEVAADVGDTAAVAAAHAVESRATAEGRSAEAEPNLNLFRFAAYALARTGRLERAVEVLELGRARELASWLHRDVAQLERVRELDPELEQRYVAAREALNAAERAARSGVTMSPAQAAPAAEELATVTALIRELPGMSRFLEEPTFDEVAATLADSEALAYPLTTPSGSLWLLAWGGQPSRVEAIELPNLSSAEIVRPLLRAAPADVGGLTGFLVASDPAALETSIRELEELLGPKLLLPLARHLDERAGSQVCLVPMGLLGRVPLHTLRFENSTGRCLLDQLPVSFAPSAFARGVCAARANDRAGTTSLLVVGNPLPHSRPLEWTEFEAEVVARTFSAPECQRLTGTAATKGAVQHALPGKSHVHLACHGRGSQEDAFALDCGLSLAQDHWLTGAELLDLDGFEPRLVVASACETSVIPGYAEADEALSLSTVLIGAGAGAVVASLWPVDDYATALLMSRFYELLEQDLSWPSEALRQAQLWLRNLSEDEARAYVASHRVLSGRLGPELQRRRGDPGHPASFGATWLWGGFTFNGAR